MVNISITDVEHLASLSSLNLSEDEVKSLQVDLSDIVSYIEQLSELDTEGIEPTYQVTDLKNVWREDEIIDYGVTPDELLLLSPESEDHAVKVPKVL